MRGGGGGGGGGGSMEGGKTDGDYIPIATILPPE